MNFNAIGFLFLKPFDESTDPKFSSLLSVASIFNSCFSIVAAAMILMNAKYSFTVFAVSLSLWVLISFVFWHQGLRARAMNQLLFVLICTGLIVYAIFAGIDLADYHLVPVNYAE